MLLALPSIAQENNMLTDAEKAAGWQLLFNGTNFDGWHCWHRTQMRPGWVIKDGCMVCANPAQAGDIVTSGEYGWFELQLDYNITPTGNSGILYHVAGENTLPPMPTWFTGPEFQLLDNVNGRDAEPRQMSGWLYGLYQPPIDPKTGKPLDTTKPVGQWNHIRIVIAPPPAASEVDVNGIKYYDFVYNSDDFKARVAKSKFRKMSGFAKSDSGFIGLQGDHGSIAFRNIKLRPISKESN